MGTPETVIVGIPCCHHTTRTLIFDAKGNLYVSCGSGSNVDPNSSHARIMRFSVGNIPQGGLNWTTGLLFADGLRNEVGLSFDAQDRLWGVENGVDDLYRADLGGDIHTNNPSEEVNLFDVPSKFYGYPYCWTEYDLPKFGKGRGSQWVHNNFINDGVHSDAWCSDTNNVVRPKWSMSAHQAPLDIQFYYGTQLPSFPPGGAFVALHGSWDRQPPAGYKIIYLSFDGGVPVGEVDVLKYNGNGAPWPNSVRPVNVVVKACGDAKECLFVTSDDSGEIIQISYIG
uniref:Pyrroloquinoline quinone-dependent pyranose dehydrogenase beta-propeller domain-containing protein n=1 Tax=Arcella intermedia TaxID=1963864 RepID=A0A6B2L6F7_9EUKA